MTGRPARAAARELNIRASRADTPGMNDPARARQEYLKGAVTSASQEQLHLMLLDGAIRFATRGVEAIQARDAEAIYNAMDRAQRIVLELINGMRREVNPELVDRMTSLYNFVYRRLVDATLHRDPGAVEDALRILRHERETWALLIDKLAAEHQAAAAALTPPPARAAPPAFAARPPADAADSHGSVLCLEG